MNKKSQITIFVIIGVVIIILFALFVIMSKKRTTFEPGTPIRKELFQNYILLCFKETFNDAKTYKGITDNFVLEEYIVENIDKCIENEVFLQFGYEVETGDKRVGVKITNTSFVASMIYPFEFHNSDKGIRFELSNFMFTLNKQSSFEILQNNNARVVGDHNFVSEEGGLQLQVYDGTLITDSYGNPIVVDKINIEIKPIENVHPASMVGGVMYEFYPDKMHFDPPVTVRFKYPKEYLASLGNRFTLSYFDEDSGWVDIPTIIDLENYYLIGEFEYLP
jgi:hypothetical protein